MSAGVVATPTATNAAEWIIRRCTQKWIGTELQYVDWPPDSIPAPMTRDEMVNALDLCASQYPDDEFAGHNVANCRCPNHSHYKPVLSEVRHAEVAH